MRYAFAVAVWLLSMVAGFAAIPSMNSFQATNGLSVGLHGPLGNQKIRYDGILLSTKASLVTASNILRSFTVSSDAAVSNSAKAYTIATSNFLYGFINAATGAVTTAQLNNVSNVIRNLLIANDSSTSNALRSLITASDITTSNSLVTLSSNNVRVAAGANIAVTPSGAGGVMTYTVDSVGGGGTGGGSVSLAPTNIPSATAFTVNANWQISCVSLAHNATVVVSNLSLGQVDCRLIVTNTGSFTMTFPQFSAGQWEDGIIPALPANRTATIIFSRPTTSVTNVLMRGQDMSLAVASPSALGTNAAGTIITITNLITVSTQTTFGVVTPAGNISELLFSNSFTVNVSGRRATLGMDTMGGSGGGTESVQTNVTASTTNNIIVDFGIANIWRIFAETNFTYTISNMASLANWPNHIVDIYFKQDTNGQRLLNAAFVDEGQFVTNATLGNMQPTTNANAVDLMQVKYGWFNSNALTIWHRDLQPRTAVMAFSPSNSQTIWLVGDDLTGLPNNTQVGLWTNRMTGQLGFTNGLAGVIKSNSIVNGHASLYFDGVGYLTSERVTNYAHYVAAEASTWFIVMRQRSTDHQNCIFQWIASGEQIDLYATYDDVIYWESPNNGPSGSISAPQPVTWDDVFHILEVVRGQDTAQILVDGAVIGSGTPSANFTVSDDSVFWYLGSTSGGGTAFNGDIAEIRAYNEALSASARATIRAALKATYNTP